MNSERRIQRVRKAIEAPREAKSDWEIICGLARAMGKGEFFNFRSAEEIWEEIRKVWKAGHGITHARLENGGLQWPCPTEDHPGTTVLHTKTFASDQRAPLSAPPESIAPVPFPADDLADVPAIAVKTRPQPLPGLPLLGREPPGLTADPDFRRQGVGERLLRDALLDAKNLGARLAFLEVRETNTAAQAMYEKFGFRITGKRPRYYRDNGEDAILMTLQPLEIE